MTVWPGIGFDYIETHWTEREFLTMVTRLRERLDKIAKREDRVPGFAGAGVRVHWTNYNDLLMADPLVREKLRERGLV